MSEHRVISLRTVRRLSPMRSFLSVSAYQVTNAYVYLRNLPLPDVKTSNPWTSRIQ